MFPPERLPAATAVEAQRMSNRSRSSVALRSMARRRRNGPALKRSPATSFSTRFSFTESAGTMPSWWRSSGT